MGVVGHEAQHTLRPEAGAEPVDKIGDRLLVDRRGRRGSTRRGEGLGRDGAEADEIEAEAGIERIGERIELFAEKTDQRLGIAPRPGGRRRRCARTAPSTR